MPQPTDQTDSPEAATAAVSEPPPSYASENTCVPRHIERHARKCRICRHRDRRLIEQEYRDWFPAADIARRYNVDDSALHRHLRAVGLFSRRNENLRAVLDRILERGAEEPLSGSTIIRAVKAYACLTDDNRWVEPERRVVYIQRNDPHEASLSASDLPRSQAPPPAPTEDAKQPAGQP